MTNQDWAMFVGTIIPAALLWLKGQTWPSIYKALVALAFAVVVAVGTNYLSGGFTSDLFGNVLRVIVATWAAYEGFWTHVGDALIKPKPEPLQLTGPAIGIYTPPSAGTGC
jgi:hypothetical protein